MKSGTDKWLTRLENCNWMNNIKDTLYCACLVAQCIDQVRFCFDNHTLFYKCNKWNASFQ